MSRRAAALVAVGALAVVGGCTSSAGVSASKPAHRPASPSAASSSPAAHPSGPLHVTVRAVHWHLPVPVSRGAVVPVGHGGVLAGGLLAGDVSTTHAYRVDPAAGTVTPIARLAVAAHDVAGATTGGAPTLFGGGGATELSVVQRLGRGSHWHVVGHLPGARSDLSAAQDGASVLLIGGYDGVTSPPALLRTSDGHRFRPVGRLPHGLRYAAVAIRNGTAWVLGGEQNDVELRSVYAIDLSTGAVRRAGRLPIATGHAAAVWVGHRILLLGGRRSPQNPTAAMWWFDPARHHWSRAGRLPYPVADAPALTVGSSTYLLGGETPSFTTRVARVSWSH